MLSELMKRDWLDAHDVIIKVTEKLINQYGRATLDKYNFSWDRLIDFLCKNNIQYKQLTDEYLNNKY